jgi:hypothetical protein
MSDAQTWQAVMLDREDGSLLEVSCSLSNHALLCSADGVSYDLPLDVSLPRTLESLRQQLEVQFSTTLHFRHCLHCIHYSSSGMALQMAQGRTGICGLHSTSVSPLFVCDDYFCYCDFSPRVAPEIEPPDSIETMEYCQDFLRCSQELSIYRHGTGVVGKSSTKVSKLLCDTLIRSAMRHPRTVSVSINSSGVRFVDFGLQKVFSVVTQADVTKWLEKEPTTSDVVVFPNPRVREHLGLNDLAEADRLSSAIALIRLWRDAQELEPRASSA